MHAAPVAADTAAPATAAPAAAAPAAAAPVSPVFDDDDNSGGGFGYNDDVDMADIHPQITAVAAVPMATRSSAQSLSCSDVEGSGDDGEDSDEKAVSNRLIAVATASVISVSSESTSSHTASALPPTKRRASEMNASIYDEVMQLREKRTCAYRQVDLARLGTRPSPPVGILVSAFESIRGILPTHSVSLSMQPFDPELAAVAKFMSGVAVPSPVIATPSQSVTGAVSAAAESVSDVVVHSTLPTSSQSSVRTSRASGGLV